MNHGLVLDVAAEVSGDGGGVPELAPCEVVRIGRDLYAAMRRRDAIRASLDQAVLQALPLRRFVTAKEISGQLDLPWRVVARTLKRLALRGEAVLKERVTVADRSRVRVRPQYKRVPRMMATGPRWFQVAAGFGGVEA